MFTIKRTVMTLLVLGFMLSSVNSQLFAQKADGDEMSILPIFVEKLDDSNFQETITQGVVIIDYHAKWCGPCKKFAPTFEKVAKEMFGKLTFGKLDIDEAPNARRQCVIASIPTIIVFKDGQEIKRKVGAFNSENDFKAFIRSAG